MDDCAHKNYSLRANIHIMNYEDIMKTAPEAV